jgi:hypothetical protein
VNDARCRDRNREGMDKIKEKLEDADKRKEGKMLNMS